LLRLLELGADLREIDSPFFSLLVWAPRTPIARYFGELPDTFAKLISWCQRIGVNLLDAIRPFRARGLQVIKGIPLVLGFLRPQRILGTDSPIELISFVLFAGTEYCDEAGELLPSAPVAVLGHRRPLTAKFARGLSKVGTTAARKPVLLVGCGAEGSKLGMHLGRSGFERITFVDAQILDPHNLVRHALLSNSVGQSKSEELKREISRIFWADKSISFSADTSDAFELLRNNEALGTYSLLVDATASSSVLNAVIDAPIQTDLHVCRCEMAHEGKLGMLFWEGQNRRPRVDDLQIVLFDLAIDCDEVSAWLFEHHASRQGILGARFEEIEIGIGCSSDTMRLADDIVSFHASVFATCIRNSLESEDLVGRIQLSTIVWNRALSSSTKTFRVSATIELRSKLQDPWRVRLCDRTSGELQRRLREAGTDETGGLLVGLVNEKRKTIYVSRVLPPSSDSEGSPFAFRRGIRDYPEILDGIHARTGHMLGYVGEWHTHPEGGPQMSGRDRRTLSDIHDCLRGTGLPAHILIVSPGGSASYVKETGAGSR
jgi:proteasome lid subunit RPN8/RPN11